MKNKKWISFLFLVVLGSGFLNAQPIEVEGYGKKVQTAIYDGIQKACGQNADTVTKKHIAAIVTKFLNDANINGPAMEKVDQEKIKQFIAELSMNVQQCQITTISTLPNNGYSAKMRILLKERFNADSSPLNADQATKEIRKKISVKVNVPQMLQENQQINAGQTLLRMNQLEKKQLNDADIEQMQSETQSRVALQKFMRVLSGTMSTQIAARLSGTGKFIATSADVKQRVSRPAGIAAAPVPAASGIAPAPPAPPAPGAVAAPQKKFVDLGYQLVCNVKDFSIAKKAVKLPGYDTTVDKITGCVSVEYNVIVNASRQIKMAKNILITPRDLNLSVTSHQSEINTAVVEKVTDIIVQEVVQQMFPLLLVKILPNGRMILNQGSSTLKVGDMYKIFSVGDEITDPVTEKLLGYVETEIGVAQIIQVAETHCYAKLVTGELRRVTYDTVFRKYVPAKVKSSAADDSGDLFPKRNPKKPWLR